MVSDEAIAAAYEKAWPYSDDDEDDLTYMLKLALEAAAPYIAAEAWEAGMSAAKLQAAGIKPAHNPYRSQA